MPPFRLYLMAAMLKIAKRRTPLLRCNVYEGLILSSGSAALLLCFARGYTNVRFNLFNGSICPNSHGNCLAPPPAAAAVLQDKPQLELQSQWIVFLLSSCSSIFELRIILLFQDWWAHSIFNFDSHTTIFRLLLSKGVQRTKKYPNLGNILCISALALAG